MKDILTTREMADYLKLKEATVRRLASQGSLPGVKIGKYWRFKMQQILMMFPGERNPETRSGNPYSED